MTKLYTDCITDGKRAEFFRDGSAHEAGIIAQAIQADVADAFAFRADAAAALDALREGYTQRADGEGASTPWRAATNLARHELDSVIEKLGLKEVR